MAPTLTKAAWVSVGLSSEQVMAPAPCSATEREVGRGRGTATTLAQHTLLHNFVQVIVYGEFSLDIVKHYSGIIGAFRPFELLVTNFDNSSKVNEAEC